MSGEDASFLIGPFFDVLSKLHLMWNFWGLRVNASWGPGNGMCCGGLLNDVRADEN